MPEQPLALINLSHLRNNYALAKTLNQQQDCFGVIKADAYGHQIKTLVQALPHADGFAVARFSEAVELRRLSPKHEIVVLSDTLNDDNIKLCLQQNLTPCAQNLQQLKHLCQQAEHPASIWIKLDTGMHRQGIGAGELAQLGATLSLLDDSCNIILMTHLACADEPAHPLNQRQIDNFSAYVKQLEQQIKIEAISIANSGALLNQLIPKFNYRHIARPGIMLYGVNPTTEYSDQGLKMAMQFSVKVLAVRTLEAGETVGYGGNNPLAKQTTVATLGIGYGDGFPRYSNDAKVLIDGQLCPVIGRVSMDLISVDVSHLESIKIGDKVEIWGDNLAIKQLAQASSTISYELLTRLSGRVRRQTI